MVPESRNCQECGNVYIARTNNARYCVDCRRPDNKGLRRLNREKRILGHKECAHCGDSFEYYDSRRKYCGVSCRISSQRDDKLLRQEAKIYKRFARKKRMTPLKRARERRLNYIHNKKQTARCKECDRSFSTMGNKRRVYCSEECSRRSNKRTYRQKRRARERNGLSKSLDATYVFIRDKWTCQICGVRTPIRNRGTNQDNAPELDHIVPLSCGGSHTYHNVQCSCRFCNNRKSDKPYGQLHIRGYAPPPIGVLTSPGSAAGA